jgi:hypothetical protein
MTMMIMVMMMVMIMMLIPCVLVLSSYSKVLTDRDRPGRIKWKSTGQGTNGEAEMAVGPPFGQEIKLSSSNFSTPRTNEWIV